MAEPAISRHLATFNLFREADNSIHVTVADAAGVKAELGESGAPLHLCAMNALRSAVELRPAERVADLPDFADVDALKLRSEREKLRGQLAENHKVRQKITNMRVRNAWDQVHGGDDDWRRRCIEAIEKEMRKRGMHV